MNRIQNTGVRIKDKTVIILDSEFRLLNSYLKKEVLCQTVKW